MEYSIGNDGRRAATGQCALVHVDGRQVMSLPSCSTPRQFEDRLYSSSWRVVGDELFRERSGRRDLLLLEI